MDQWVKWLLDRFETFELNIPSDRVFSGLSENHKIIQIEHNSHHDHKLTDSELQGNNYVLGLTFDGFL